jgi:lipid A disaccharide synthetase
MDSDIVRLEGRIIAQELLMRALYAGSLWNASDPLAALEQTRRDFRETLQKLHRPIGDEADAVWEAAADALFKELDQVEKRIKDDLQDRA